MPGFHFSPLASRMPNFIPCVGQHLSAATLCYSDGRPGPGSAGALSLAAVQHPCSVRWPLRHVGKHPVFVSVLTVIGKHRGIGKQKRKEHYAILGH